MDNSYFFIALFLGTVALSWLWVDGFDNMRRKHPDYKGEDFLDSEDKKNNTK